MKNYLDRLGKEDLPWDLVIDKIFKQYEEQERNWEAVTPKVIAVLIEGLQDNL